MWKWKSWALRDGSSSPKVCLFMYIYEWKNIDRQGITLNIEWSPFKSQHIVELKIRRSVYFIRSGYVCWYGWLCVSCRSSSSSERIFPSPPRFLCSPTVFAVPFSSRAAFELHSPCCCRVIFHETKIATKIGFLATCPLATCPPLSLNVSSSSD